MGKGAASAIGGVAGLAGNLLGAGDTGSSATRSQQQIQDISNFRPFQQPAIQAVFDALQPGLLNVPPGATRGIGTAQNINFNNLLQSLRQPASDEFRSIIDIVNQDISAQPFEEANDRFEKIFRRAENFQADLLGGGDPRFQVGGPNQAIEILRSQLGQDPSARAIDLLLPTAQGDFLNANPFFEEGVVQPALDDARNQVASVLSNGGRLRGSGNAAQSIARETGRIGAGLRSNQFNVERGLQQQAQQLIGGFDANEAIRKLNTASQIGQFDQADETDRLNFINTISNLFNPQLGAAQGIGNITVQDQNRRQGLLGLRQNAASGLAGLQQQAIANAPLLAQAQTELPFIPLTNFSNIAFQPLGQFGTTNTTGTGTQTQQQSPFQSAAGGALVGGGIADSGLFGGGTADKFSPVPPVPVGSPLNFPGVFQPFG